MTRHERIVSEAEDLAGECFWDRIDPSEAQVARTVEAAVGHGLTTHEARVAWCAYREKFADHATGRA